MTVGAHIHALRIEKRLPQKSIAQYLNVSISTVSNYEVDRHLPDIQTLSKLADLYDVSVDYILGRTKYRNFYKGKYESLKQNTENVLNNEEVYKRFCSLDEEQKKKILAYIEEISER